MSQTLKQIIFLICENRQYFSFVKTDKVLLWGSARPSAELRLFHVSISKGPCLANVAC